MGWAYGLANLDDGIPITPKTSFHLASLSKQFTASAIALLILNHKIALSDSVAIYIPEVAKYGQGLRIEHLVYMTSGIHEYTDVPRTNGVPWMAASEIERPRLSCRPLGGGRGTGDMKKTVQTPHDKRRGRGKKCLNRRYRGAVENFQRGTAG
jgi:CubicO group peptidase (beta-lactamase class C family)